MKYNLRDHESGDTLSPTEFELLVNGTAKNLTGAAITAIFTLGVNEQTLTVGSGITITNAAGGKFKLDAQVIDWPAGQWQYEITITFSDNTVKTYIKGSFKITK